MADELVQRWLGALAWVQRRNAKVRGAFHILQASLRSLDSGDDGLRQWAEARAGFCLPPGATVQELERALCRRFENNASARLLYAEEPVLVDRANPVVRALSAAVAAQGLPVRHVVKTGTCDLNVVAPRWRVPMAVYGPGDSALDHAPDERISLQEYMLSIDMLTLALSRLLEEAATGREGGRHDAA